MSWTYVLDNLGSDPGTQVRYLIGDTNASDKLVQDEEIAFALAQRSSIYGAAAMVCRSISARLAREADTVDQNLQNRYSVRSIAFAKQAIAFEAQAAQRAPGMPYAGGIGIADKIRQEQDADRAAPQFDIGMDDNFEPVAPAGNEAEPACESDE